MGRRPGAQARMGLDPRSPVSLGWPCALVDMPLPRSAPRLQPLCLHTSTWLSWSRRTEAAHLGRGRVSAQEKRPMLGTQGSDASGDKYRGLSGHVKSNSRRQLPRVPNPPTAPTSLPDTGLSQWGLGRASTVILSSNIYLAWASGYRGRQERKGPDFLELLFRQEDTEETVNQNAQHIRQRFLLQSSAEQGPREGRLP